MDFTLTDEQQMIVETAGSLLAKECRPSVPRGAMDDPAVADRLWDHLSDWAPLGEGPLVDLALFLEQTGAVVAPGPYLSTVGLALPLLRTAGATDAADRVAAGHATATVVGVGPLALEAVRADVLVQLSDQGIAVHRPATVEIAEVATLDGTRRMHEVRPTGAPGAEHPVDRDELDRWWERAWVAVAAEMVGTARRLLDMTVAYAKERVQFGQPIGAFQAVQHQLADTALEVERATAAVYEAAMVVDADRAADERRRTAHVAKAAAGAAATRAAKQGIQTHGGIGYTWEHDLHLYIRRAYATEHFLGTRAWHHEQLGRLLVGSPAT